jgi:hypothetical protein
MLRLELLPAGCGDCLWLEYGKPGETHIVLIDGGVEDTAGRLEARIQEAIKERQATPLHIDLLVVTHIDNDHIRGILKLLGEAKLPLTFDDIWFNGNQQLAHLPPPTKDEQRLDRLGGENEGMFRPDLLGLREGDRLSQLLSDPSRHLPWNRAFQGKEISISSGRPLPVKPLSGGMNLTLLGPPLKRLRRLGADWLKVLGDFKRGLPETADIRSDLLGKGDTWPPTWRNEEEFDERTANGSSISLWAEYEGQALLLTGDAFAEDVTAALGRLQVERNTNMPLPLSAFKLSHHGSAKNLSRDLLDRINCPRYLISTDGSIYRHPDHLALLRILSYSKAHPKLLFNYRVDTTQNWQDRKQEVLDAGFPSYDTVYRDQPERSLVVELS